MADDNATDTTETETSTETTRTEAEQTTDTSTEEKSLIGAVGEEVDPDPDPDADKEGEDKEGDDKEGEKKEEAAAGPPETYELTAPEGLEITPEIVAEVDPVFRELGLNSDQANKVIALAKPFSDRILKAQADAHEALGADWAKEAKADPRIGKKNWADTERFVAKALDTAAAGLGKGGKEQVAAFKELLDTTRFGNHPVLISMFRFYGERISEDSDFVHSDKGTAVPKSREEVLYRDPASQGE